MSICDFKNLDPNDISEHPLLAKIPLLCAEKYEVLKATIAIRGVEHPITCIRGKGDQYLLIDGRHRLKAAKELHLQRIQSAIQSDGEDVLKFILDTAITGRQLTKTAICLLLLEQHPDLTSERGDRKGGRPVNIESKTVDSVNSYRAIAKKYQVPFEYFSRILGVKEMCRAKSRDLDHLRDIVYRQEICANRLASSMQGWMAEHPLGKPVGDKDIIEVVKGKGQVNLNDGLPRSIMFICNQAKRWLELPPEKEIKCRDMWRETIHNLPDKILELTRDAAIEAIKKRAHDKKN